MRGFIFGGSFCRDHSSYETQKRERERERGETGRQTDMVAGTFPKKLKPCALFLEEA